MLARLVRIGFFCYLGLLIMLAAFQRTLIYGPLRGPVSTQGTGLAASEVEEVTLTREPGITLHGWRTKAEGEPAQRRLMILFPGNAGNRSYRTNILRSFNQLGCDALIYDYRGYGENAGSPSEEALAGDALAIWEQATQQWGYAPGNIILCGESLGGGVATRLAWDLHQKQVTVGGLVLRTTFTSLTDTAAWLYPWLPVRLVLVDRYPSIDRIGQLQCPILVIHGERDSIVPFALGERLFAAAPKTSASGVEKAFLRLPKANHNDVEVVAGPEIHDAHRSFLGRITAAEAPR